MAPPDQSDPQDEATQDQDYSLFQNEERVLAETEEMLGKLESVGGGVRTLAEAYRQSYKEQQRLVRMSDKFQLQLQKANSKLEAQAEELKALNKSLKKEIAQRTKLSEELERMANVDMLTEAFTRRYFIELVERELKRRERKQAPMALLLADFDHFKEVNDSGGHHMGDKALKLFGAECRKCLRDSDIFGRLGGEEFSIALPDSDLAAAEQVANRIRESIESATRLDPDLQIGVTVSIGITMFRENDRIERALRRADAALYEAKAQGRNRIVVDG